MGLKHLPVTVLAVCVVSVGGTGFAEEGPPQDPPPDNITEAECDLAFPFDCNEECKEYARCLADEPSGDPLAPLACWKELDEFSLCEFGLTLPVPPPLTPPEGQHCHGSDCHDDHVCGDDEIGGGAVECETCTDGRCLTTTRRSAWNV